jgi:transcriptional regulator with XRE-family HTH domain
MPSYHIGTLVRRLRKQKGLTQEELAYPIIDRATLSKIETGETMPSKTTVEALFFRLGFNPHNLINFFLTNEDAKTQKIVERLKSILFNETARGGHEALVSECKELINQLENQEKFMDDKLNIQYLLKTKACVSMLEKAHEVALGLLEQAINITIPGYDETQIVQYHLTQQEAGIISNFCIAYSNLGRTEEGLALCLRLKENLETNCIDQDTMGYMYPSLISNIAVCLWRLKRYEECIKMCDDGIKVCKDTARLRTLPIIVGYKAGALFQLGAREEAEKLVKQVYHASEMFGLYGQKEIARKFAQTHDITL